MKYTTFCRGINWDCAASLKKYNEIYLIKYIKSVLWRVAERLSYIQDAWCLNVNVTQDRNEWSILVKTAMNLRVAWKAWIFCWAGKWRLASEGLYCASISFGFEMYEVICKYLRIRFSLSASGWALYLYSGSNGWRWECDKCGIF